MTCSPQTECGINGSISINGGNIKTATSCCMKDFCIPTLPTLPADSSHSNGLRCRSCISTDSTWCYTLANVQCTGNETMCVLQTTEQSGSTSLSMAARGCATKSLCDLKTQVYKTNDLTTVNQYICTSGCHNKRPYEITIVWILLLRLLF
uniref:UPAR/Ly6 domain-containing protein n=1 Tax=Pyxicephalus adspersus TaxID=30357 RepID=A0AAV2ZG95_PYXAD|nr:TPA: hypothetical protein GDO54_003258 [Pyxicephalus adspersus]